MTITHELYAENGKYFAFADNPIAITCTMASNEFTNATLTQVVIDVTIGSNTHSFNAEVGNSESVTIDVSSAFRTEYAKGTVAYNSTGYTVLTGTITAHKRYLPDGTLEMADGTVQNVVSSLYVLRGGVEPAVIWNEGLSPLTAVKKYKNLLSTKPRPEIVNHGDVVKRSTFDMTTTFAVTTTTVTADIDTALTGGIVEKDDMRKCLLFVNRFGVIENASAITLEKKKYNTATMTPMWEMSSGYVTRDWAEWWITEFLRGKTSTVRGQKASFLPARTPKYWLMVGTNKFLPVNIEFDEELDVYDRAKQELIEVRFNVISEI